MQTEATSLLNFPQTPEDRLRLALRRLEGALAEQSAAIAGFRESLASLRQAASSLGGQMHAYQATLGQTADKARQAHEAARQLEKTADRMAALG